MEADYSTALTLLLRYPSPGRPHGPSTFVDDSLYLRDNLTITGGIEIISKYSGKPPAPLRPESRPSTPRQRPTHSKKPSISTQEKLSSRIRAPLTSPSRFIQQQGGLEALLQDAARGFYDRGEKWGVNKAVRDAVDEVKRNVQGLQQSAGVIPPRRAAQASSRWPPDEGGVVQATEAAKAITAEVQRLSERNKTLANMLGDAIDTLWAQQKGTTKEDSPEGGGAMEAFNLAIAKIQLVKVFLEDSDLPLTEGQHLRYTGSSTTDTVPQPKPDQPIAPTTTAAGVTTLAPQALSTNTPGTPSIQSLPIPSSPTSAAAATETPPQPRTPSSTTTPPEPRSKPTTSLHHPRSSLAQSSFAWMLGDNENDKQSPRRDAAASFAEFSSPSSSLRASSNVARKGFLFGGGDGRDDSDDGGNGNGLSGVAQGRGKRRSEIVRAVGGAEEGEESFSLESLG
jgi:TBC1 domain family member 5